MQLDPSVVRKVAVRRDEATSFPAPETKRNLTRKISFAGTINSSLYKSAARRMCRSRCWRNWCGFTVGMSISSAKFRKATRSKSAYERLLDDDGHVVRHGRSYLCTNDPVRSGETAYRFELRPGKTDYFDDTGRSAKRPLLRTPDRRRPTSSRFGKRRIRYWVH